jgi:hypothetical protein
MACLLNRDSLLHRHDAPLTVALGDACLRISNIRKHGGHTGPESLLSMGDCTLRRRLGSKARRPVIQPHERLNEAWATLKGSNKSASMQTDLDAYS